MDAAEAAFSRDGYERARIEEIAQDADVSVGSIYVHFGSKERLWAALADRALERFEAYLEQAYQPRWRPLDQVIACGDAYLRFHSDHPGSFRFLAFDGTQARIATDDPEITARASVRLQSIIDGFQDKIAEAMAAGEARPGNARLVARFLWAAWNGTVALTLRSDGLALDEPALEECIEQARLVVLEGLTDPSFRRPDGTTRGALQSVERPRLPGPDPEEQAP